MIFMQPGLYVRIAEMTGDRAPTPLPLASGFNSDTAYRVLGAYSPSETSEAYFVLSNDEDQVWFGSNRHGLTCKNLPDANELRVRLTGVGLCMLV